MSIKHFENKRWSNFDSNIGFRHRAALELIEGNSVLDLGAGDGIFLEILGDRFEKKSGLDISEEAVKKAKEKGFNVRVFDFATQKLPYSDNYFDSVVMLDVLEHLYNPEHIIEESKRVSKRCLIIGVPNFSSFPARIQTLLGKVPENNTPGKGHVYWFNFVELGKLLKSCGLKITSIKVNYFWQNIPIVGGIIKYLSKILPGVFALSFVVKAEKI